ncbi:MAG: hypothetical protein KZQ83_11095 [gamma proteobacterium symbiont of Taylorina sp.]|nr:hypothetical protein [gamma proteobacterium symbiont of Taylorina sp.]
MGYRKFFYSIYLLYCYLSVVYAADDDFSEMEKEIQLNPPGIGNTYDAATAYSKVRDISLDKAIETRFKNIQSETDISSENDASAAYLELNKDSIKVYIFKQKNSAFATFRATTIINSPLESVLAVMLDIKSSTKWVDSCKTSFVIKKLSFNEQYHYQTFYIPFPFRNRDFIFHSTMVHDPLNKTITITMSSAADYCQDKQSSQCQLVNQSNLVRINKSIGTFKLEEKLLAGKKGTKITWIQHTNPAGNLPAWLVNQLIKNTAYRSFKNLALIAREKQYKNAKLTYGSNGIVIAIEMKKSAGKQE